MNIRFRIKKLWLVLSNPFKHTYTANICNHKTKLEGPMSDGKHTITMKMPLAENGNPDYCLKCIGEMSIKCAWCNNPITIGSPITLYTPKDDYDIPEYAVPYTENDSKALVGCLGWECAHSGADMCGRWMPPGKVERQPSPLELCMMANQGNEENMVIISDINNYPASASIHQMNKESS